MRAIDRLQVKVIYTDVRKNPKERIRLIKDTGIATVPCLYIDGRPMHESEDIVSWLEEHADLLENI